MHHTRFLVLLEGLADLLLLRFALHRFGGQSLHRQLPFKVLGQYRFRNPCHRERAARTCCRTSVLGWMHDNVIEHVCDSEQ